MIDRVLEDFIVLHGEPQWKGTWAFFPDGVEGEHTVLGFRPIPSREPERQAEVRQMFWKLRLQDLSQQFYAMRDRCEDLAGYGKLSDDDIEGLRQLQGQVQEAAAELDRLANPPGPDAKEVRKAVKLYRQVRQLAVVCCQAERHYNLHPSKKSAERWESSWDRWDEANQIYQQIDEQVRRAAESQVADEAFRAKIEEQRTEIETIEI